MTTHVPMARVPFAPLDNPRLQHLASAKNRQNGITTKSLLGDKSSPLPSKLSTKRPLEICSLDEFNAENIDPGDLDSAPWKKSKADTLSFTKPSAIFSLTPVKSTMPPPPSRISTPVRANMSSPRTAMSAPAGRSPTKRKSGGILKNRRVSAPFTRIDPPFASRSTAGLPFSLDAALNGTLSKSASKTAGLTIQESMPQNWFFDIHEDTPEEEAGNLMEHSTCTLDLSSDDETTKRQNDDRGKENVAPDGYDAPVASRPVAIAAPGQAQATPKMEIVRSKVVTDEMDDGLRSPLCDLQTDPFIPDGLDKDSHVIVDAEGDKPKLDVKNLFASPVDFTSGVNQKLDALVDVPVVTADGDLKGGIIVWNDPENTPETS